jgi:hypothetical protein
MNRGLIFGDSHGSIENLTAIYKYVLPKTYDFTFSVGDFGYWPRNEKGQAFLRHCSNLVQESGVPMYWVPGNHEDYEMINELIKKGNRDEWGFIECAPGVFMAPRSLSWTWGYTRFCAIGGAFSIDRDSRVLNSGNHGWFHEELPTWADLDAIGGDCNVMITHDAAVNIALKIGWKNLDRHGIGRNIYPIIQAGIRISNATQIISGHWHRRFEYDLKIDQRRVKGHVLSYTHGALREGLADIINGQIKPWVKAPTIYEWDTST